MKTVQTLKQKLPSRSKAARMAAIAGYGVAGAVMIASPAFAQQVGGGDVGAFFANAAELVVSGWGKGICLLAILVVGFTCLSGRLNLGMAFSVVMGIVIIFGSSAIFAGVTGNA